MTYERREQFWQRVLAQTDTRHVCLVAEDEAGEIVGFATGGPERAGAYPFAGEIYSIYIRAENQGQGLGRRLMQAAAEQLARQGMLSVMVWVAAANPFRRFYEALGGQEVDRKQEEMGGQLIEEVAYGWPDIDILNPQQTEASDEDSFAGVIGLFDGPTEIDHNDIYRGDPENPR
jgi:L-amino acid N-acyltransferase YncA